MSNSMDRMVEALKGQAKTEIKNAVTEAIPFQLRPNPEYSTEVDEEEMEFSEEENPEDVEAIDMQSLAFEYSDADANLAAAAAAYRMLATDDDIIATHGDTGRSFFGSEDGLKEYVSTVDLDDDGWHLYDDTKEIMALEYDQNTMEDILRNWDDSRMDAAQNQFEKFHWGDQSETTVIKQIEGIEAPLAFLGIGREICYGSKKDGKWEEYYHIFGEESGTYPSVYALGDNTLVVHGGQMRVESAGIVD
jgi:hypothetical protein